MIKKINSKIIHQTPWLSIREDKVEFSKNNLGLYTVVDKKDFALIIPFDGEFFHLVQQYRYPLGRNSLEFVQGMHENNLAIAPAALAKAELKEELGIVAKQVLHLGYFNEAPGFCSQGCHVFYATDLEFGENNPDQNEVNLIHKKAKLTDLEAMIADGEIVDAVSIAGYGLLKARKII